MIFIVHKNIFEIYLMYILYILIYNEETTNSIHLII